MRSTLFLIPHEVFPGIPLFGFGLLLGLIVLAAVSWLTWAAVKQRAVAEFASSLPFFAVAGVIVTFVLPNVEQVLPDGTPVGLPIRGYGVMVLCGLLAGIGISIHRGNQLGIVADTIIGLGFWMMLGGIVGARAFFVIQKWEDFAGNLVSIAMLTEGGLVIYGGVVGGLVAGGLYCWRHKLNVAATADLVAPGFLVGLSIGRIGCLLHGCCFGGVCQAALPAIHFPAFSVPYDAQLESGQLLGVQLKDAFSPPGTIESVLPGSPADHAAWKSGQYLQSIGLAIAGQPSNPVLPVPLSANCLVDGRETVFTPDQLPTQSLATHPSQIYAAINALLLCLLVWHIQPLPQRDGTTFLIAILLYAISRFLLELVRSDEAGQLGTPFTIAQLVAIASAVVAAVLLLLASRLPKGRVWQWRQLAESAD